MLWLIASWGGEMSELYKDRFRGYLIDHHSPAPPIVNFKFLNIQEHADFFRNSRIDSLMVYCKDNWGYSYYNTRIGERHPALDRDWVAEIVSVLRSQDIEFNAYYCVEYDNTIVLKHPEWAIRTASGNELRCGARNAKWRMPCYMTRYRAYVLEQLTEIVSIYKPDSLFLDIFGKSLCYCPACRKSFLEKTGYALPEQAEDLKAVVPQVIKFLDDCADDFLVDVLATVKGIDPALAVTINFAAHYPKRIRDRLDYHFTEPWAGNWLSAAYARATGRYPQLGPGDVSRIFNYQSSNVHRAAAAQIAAQDCRVFFYSEPLRPDGSLESEESVRIGAAFQEVQKFRHLLGDREKVADIGILQCDLSLSVGTEGQLVPGAIGRARAPNRHTNALLGAMKVCDYSKYTWTIVPVNELILEKVKTFHLLILPEVLVLAAETWQLLVAYMQSGGTVLATGETGLHAPAGDLNQDFIFSADTDIHFKALRTEYMANQWGGYAHFKREGSLTSLPDTDAPISSTSVRFSFPGKSTADFTRPAVVVGPETWVNWGFPPPSERTSEALVVRKTIDTGAFLYFGFDLFGIAAADAVWVKQYLPLILLKDLEGSFMRLETEFPESVSYTAFRRKDELILHFISQLPTITGGDAPPVATGSLYIHTDSDLVAEEVYPGSRTIALTRNGSSVRMEPGEVSIHKIIVIKERGE